MLAKRRRKRNGKNCAERYWGAYRISLFPETVEGVRTPPARVMSGIQFFEALIDDQLLPTQAYVDLLNKHGFKNVDAFDMTPVHAVTYGQK